jgi:hypothetical protein
MLSLFLSNTHTLTTPTQLKCEAFFLRADHSPAHDNAHRTNDNINDDKDDDDDHIDDTASDVGSLDWWDPKP